MKFFKKFGLTLLMIKVQIKINKFVLGTARII